MTNEEVDSDSYQWFINSLSTRCSGKKRSEEIFNKLTIVIPSYGRHKYLLRQILFWSDTNVLILIEDGSTEPLAEKYLSAIKIALNIQYSHSNLSYVDRLKRAASQIKTPYSMCLADDDFYLTSGLIKTIKFLELNSSFSCCMGQSIGFERSVIGQYFFPYGDSLKNYEICDSKIEIRLGLGIANYRSATSYAVFKTNAFVKIWGQIERVSCPEALEYEHAIYTYANGNLSTIPDLYWIRSFECDGISNVIDGSRSNTFSTWFNSPNFIEQRNCYINRISKNIINYGVKSERAYKITVSLLELILDGSHVGLMNSNKLIYWIADILRGINSSPSCSRLYLTIKGSWFGKISRAILLRALRGQVGGLNNTSQKYELLFNKYELVELDKFIKNFHNNMIK